MLVTALMEVLFAGALLSVLADLSAKRMGRRRAYLPGGVATAALAFSLVLMLLGWRGYLGKTTFAQPTVSPLASLYMANEYTLFVTFTALVVGLLVAVYSTGWMSEKMNSGPFYGMLLLLICSVSGVAAAGDFLTLFLFWEGMSVSAYGLVSFQKTSSLSMEASLKYFFMAGIGSLVALFGIALVYSLTGSIQLSAISGLEGNSLVGTLGVLSILLGFGVEAAIAPVHTWLPDVYSSAPTPVAAVVSGVVTGVGVFALLKVLQPFGASHVTFPGIVDVQAALAFLGLLTMLIGNLGGLAQTNLRRLLGYSSVAQSGYMISALSTLSPLGFLAVVLTIWNHGVLKSGFFTLTGTVEEGYEGAELSKLSGLGRQNRTVGAMFAFLSLAMVGAPPFGLFWAELLIVTSLVSAPQWYFLWLGVLVALNIVLSIGYYYRIINGVVFGKPENSFGKVKKSKLGVPVALMGLSIVSGIFPMILLTMLR